MRSALIVVAVLIIALCIVASPVVLGLLRHAHVDTAGQGVLLLDTTQAAECAAGGGCSAWSLRELEALYLRASQACKRTDV